MLFSFEGRGISLVSQDLSALVSTKHGLLNSQDWAKEWFQQVKRGLGFGIGQIREPPLPSQTSFRGEGVFRGEDVRDHLNELAELATRASGFMGTGGP